MRTRTYLWVGIVSVAVAAGVVVLGPAERNHEAQRAPAAEVRSEPAVGDSNTAAPPPAEVVASPAPLESAPSEEPVTAQINDKTFRVNDSGRLVLDAQTRLNMEALFARTERADLATAKQQAVEQLPAGAAAQATDLLEHYDNYQQAQRPAYPPGVAPSTEEAALAELEGLHALRAAHFGPVIARALYGEEEAVSRRLIELMRLEKDPSLTMQEKAARAQQLNDRGEREDPH
ncbi:MAG TPA: lipase secretion chaperone [Steroidobacteraceae bacterium]|jgi:hypothetical protein